MRLKWKRLWSPRPRTRRREMQRAERIYGPTPPLDELLAGIEFEGWFDESREAR